MRKKIYISLPVSQRDGTAQRAKADAIKTALSKQGWEVVNPFDIYVGRNPEYADRMAADIRALMDCDAIYMCEGWMDSCGCNIELAVAKTLTRFKRKEIRIIYESSTPC